MKRIWVGSMSNLLDMKIYRTKLVREHLRTNHGASIGQVWYIRATCEGNKSGIVFIAYEANGKQLQPDLGFPFILIIPGYIGGRMIWTDINLLEHETKNHYHYHDNQSYLAPAEESLMGGWWYKPEYL